MNATDGKITASDAIFSQLKLWQDSNHNGVSEPSELKALTGFVEGFDLNYKESKRTDANGNQFRYRAKVYGQEDSKTDAGLGTYF